jgi:hypothetical protein
MSDDLLGTVKTWLDGGKFLACNDASVEEVLRALVAKCDQAEAERDDLRVEVRRLLTACDLLRARREP